MFRSIVVAAIVAGAAYVDDAKSNIPGRSSPARLFAFRLTPSQDLRQELIAFSRRKHLQAGAVVTCVGSLTDVTLRLANQDKPTNRQGHFEIVSLVGTLDPSGGHLHLCVTDRDGVAFGGHLVDGCRIYTTAEIVVAELTDLELRREVDKTFGYKELVVRPRKDSP